MNARESQSFWNEKWVPIVFEGIIKPPRYEVSNYGRLRSFQPTAASRSASADSPVSSKFIKGSVIQGYRSLNIRSEGKTLNRYIHKLVAEEFVKRAQPEQMFVIHLDYDKQNNYHYNLKWVTREEMIEHNRNNPSLKNRLLPRQTSNYKLTETKVRIIKKLLLNDKNRLKMIAKQFGITHTQLNRIRSGENWKHVTLD